MKPIEIILLILLPLNIFAQQCDCASTFEWVKQTFEENDAGFQYIVDKKGVQSYMLHNQIYFEKTKAIDKAKECEISIRKWLSFFRKAHVEFHFTGEIEDQGTEEKGVDGTEIDDTSKVVQGPKNQLHERFLKSNLPFVEQLNENTLYLRIPSFRANQKQYIDSVVLTYRAQILSTENLIIDIRNGTGGSDVSYEELMPFIYTNPIRMPTLEFRSTPLNNQRMYEMATNTGLALQWGLNPTEKEMKEYQANFDILSNHIGEFVNLNPNSISITKLDTVYPFPDQVAILINHNNASTDEQFLLEARQSKKVKLFGARTLGALDVSNLYITFSPAKDFVLVYALSKSLRIPNMAIDDIGIMPDYYIDEEILEQDWINYVSDILNN